MKKRLRRWLSVVSVLAMLFCLTPPVTADTDPQDESPFVDIDTLPDNIRTLLDLNNTGNVGGVPGRSVAPAAEAPLLQVVNTDDLNSIRVEDSSGNGTAKVFGVPVRYEDDEGETHFIDTSMAGESLLTSLIDGYDYRNAANSFSVQYSKKSDKGIRVDKAFTMAVYNPEKEKLPKGYTDQTTEGYGRMVYPQAFGEHTYIEYINTNTGVKENIVLEENTGRNRFDFVFASEEYLPVLTEDGLTVQIVRKDNPEEILYRLTSLYVYDSYQPEATGPEEEPSREPVFVGPGTAEYAEEELPETMGPVPAKHYTEDNHYEVEALGDGKYRITSVVSADFLNSPDTVYPVTIDPSLGSTDSNSQDSYVWEAEPDGKYGSLNYIRFGKDNGGKIYGYHRFHQLPALPDKVNITDGWLKFTFRSGQTTGADGICRIVDSKQWYESNITWNTQPYGNWGFTSSHHNFQYYEFYMKPFLEMWVNGDYRNYGVMFTYNNMISDYNSVVSSEGEAHRAPTLTYTYTTALEIRDGGRYVGQLGQGGHHWYKFVPSVSGKYVFYTDGSTDTYGELYYGAQRLAVNNDGGEGSNFQLEYTLTAGLAYYIKVRGYNYTKTGAYGLNVKGKKAIIIVPGIMGTELKLTTDTNGFPAGTIVWPPLEKGASPGADAVSKLQALACDSNGNSVLSYVGVNENDNYGADDEYKILYDYLVANFGSSHDIIFYGYDWRMANDSSAVGLKLKTNQYVKVSIIAHSMGGLVTSHMLKDTAVRSKIETVITMGTPFLGSQEMLPVLSNGDLGALDDILNNSIIERLMKSVLLKPLLKSLAINIPTVYEILPNKRFFSLSSRYYFADVDLLGNNWMTTFDLTKKALPGINELYNTNLFDAATVRNDSLWPSGNTHVTSYVNTYYIIGEGQNTGRRYMHNQWTGSYSCDTVTGGDGSVLAYSASMNDIYPSRTFFTTSKHGDLIKLSGSNASPNILGFVKNLLNGNTTLTSGMRTDPSPGSPWD